MKEINESQPSTQRTVHSRLITYWLTSQALSPMSLSLLEATSAVLLLHAGAAYTDVSFLSREASCLSDTERHAFQASLPSPSAIALRASVPAVASSRTLLSSRSLGVTVH